MDVLIVDAAAHDEHGLHAPPLAFRSPAFWASVARAMNPAGAAMSLNLVGNAEAIVALQRIVFQELSGWSFRSIPPPPGGLPDVLSLDSQLLFGTSDVSPTGAELWKTGLVESLVDESNVWLDHWSNCPLHRSSQS